MPISEPSKPEADPMDQPKGRRSVKLDALRGIAILLVIGRHQRIQPSAAGALFAPAAVWQRIGWTGVDLFFVLSGFLVGGLLVKEILKYGNLHPTRFLVRRGLKIWPSYYLFLAFVAVKTLWIDQANPPVQFAQLWHNIWPSVFNVQNYLWQIRPHFYLWSLGVEEHFYLVLPLALLCFASTPALLAKRRVLIALMVVFVTCLVLRIMTKDVLPDYENRYYTHLRIDSLAFGFLLTYIFHFRPEWWKWLGQWRGLLFLGGLLLVVPFAMLPYPSRLLGSIGLTAIYLGYGAILIAFVSAHPHWLDRILEGWMGRCLAFVGFSSYSIYLWHFVLGSAAVKAFDPKALARYPELHWLAVTAAFALAAILGGVLIGRAVEMPVLHFRDRVFPTRLGQPQAELSTLAKNEKVA